MGFSRDEQAKRLPEKAGRVGDTAGLHSFLPTIVGPPGCAVGVLGLRFVKTLSEACFQVERGLRDLHCEQCEGRSAEWSNGCA